TRGLWPGLRWSLVGLRIPPGVEVAHPGLRRRLVRPTLTGVGQGDPACSPEPAILASVEDGDDLTPVLPFLDLEGPGIPDRDLAGTVLALGDPSFEIGVLERMVLRLHRQTVVLRIGRRALRQGPGAEHSFVFEAEIPVQSARVMLLDDEAEITSAGTVSVGDRLIRVLRIPSAPVDLQAIALGFLRCFDTAAGRLGEGLEQVSVVVEAVEDLLEPQLNDGRRIVELVPCAGRGDG